MPLTTLQPHAFLASPSLLRSTCAVLQTNHVCVSALLSASFLQYIIDWDRSVNQISKLVLSQSKARFCLLQSVGRRAWIRFNWLSHTFVPSTPATFTVTSSETLRRPYNYVYVRCLISLLTHLQFAVPLPHYIWYSMLHLEHQSPQSRSLLKAVL
jgi:hypothetical protein